MNIIPYFIFTPIIISGFIFYLPSILGLISIVIIDSIKIELFTIMYYDSIDIVSKIKNFINN